MKRPSILGVSPGSQVENSFMKFDSQLCKHLHFFIPVKLGPENKTTTNYRPTFWITIGPLSRSQSSCNVKSWWI